MAKTVLGIRIEKDLKDRATQKAAAQGVTLSAAVIEMIAKWCDGEEGAIVEKDNTPLLPLIKAVRLPDKSPTYARSRSAQVHCQIEAKLKEQANTLAQCKGYRLSAVARQLLYAWTRDAQRNEGLSDLQMATSAYKTGDKANLVFVVSLGSSRDAQAELKKRSATMSQLVGTLLKEWVRANS